MVRVEVLAGGARLEFDARAETNGRKGEIVTMRNPSSGKAFQGARYGRFSGAGNPAWIAGGGDKVKRLISVCFGFGAAVSGCAEEG